MKIEKMLGIVIVLQCLILLGQWTGLPANSSAHADIMNPGERQLALLEEAKQTNAKLERMLGVLTGGEMTVKVAKDEEKK